MYLITLTASCHLPVQGLAILRYNNRPAQELTAPCPPFIPAPNVAVLRLLHESKFLLPYNPAPIGGLKLFYNLINPAPIGGNFVQLFGN